MGAWGSEEPPPQPMAQRGDCTTGAPGHWLLGLSWMHIDEQGPLHDAEMREGTAHREETDGLH